MNNSELDVLRIKAKMLGIVARSLRHNHQVQWFVGYGVPFFNEEAALRFAIERKKEEHAKSFKRKQT